MKEKYVEAEMEIIEFNSEDVIRTSGVNLPFVPNDQNGEVYDNEGNLIDIVK